MTHKELDSFYRNVSKEIKKIVKATRVIDLKLHKLFQDLLYSFDITIDGKMYSIQYEFEQERMVDQMEIRKSVIKQVVKIALEDMVENLQDDAQSFDAFGSILEFANITANEDMQVSREEKITPDNPRYEEIMAELKQKHEQGIDLDKKSKVVQFQLPGYYDKEFEEMKAIKIAELKKIIINKDDSIIKDNLNQNGLYNKIKESDESDKMV